MLFRLQLWIFTAFAVISFSLCNLSSKTIVVSASDPFEDARRAPGFSCYDGPEALYSDDLPYEADRILPSRIAVEPIGQASLISFSSDRFGLSEEGGAYVLASGGLASGPRVSETELVFAVGDEPVSWKLYTFRNAFGQETFSRMSAADAAAYNNIYMLKHGLIGRAAYDLNVSGLSHGDLDLVYGERASKGDYYATADGLPPAGANNRPTGRQYSGHVLLQDYTGAYHGLGYFRLYLIGRSTSTSQYEVVSYCDLPYGGAFSLTCPDTGYEDIYFRIYSHFPCCSFKDANDEVYYIDLVHTSLPPVSFANANVLIPLTNDRNPILWAVSIARCSYLYARHLTNNAFSEPVTLIYYGGSDPQMFSYAAYKYFDGYGGYIIFNSNEIALTQGHLNAPQNWDVVSHEYGHHVSAITFLAEELSQGQLALLEEYKLYCDPRHCSSNSDCDEQYGQLYNRYYANTPETPLPLAEISRLGREIGLVQAWRESWPTFFGNCMIHYLDAYLENYPTCHDDFYGPEGGSGSFSYVEDTGDKTDSCEQSLISFLFHLNDADNSETFDDLAVSDQLIFAIARDYQCLTFNDFYLALIDYGISPDSLGKLLEHFEICPSRGGVSVASSGGYVTIDSDFSDNHSHYGFDHLEYVFFTGAPNQSGSNVALTAPSASGGTSIELPLSAFNSLCNGSTQYLVVRAVYPSGDPDCFYSSRYITIDKYRMEVFWYD